MLPSSVMVFLLTECTPPRPQDVLFHIVEAVKAGRILVWKFCQLVIMLLHPYSSWHNDMKQGHCFFVVCVLAFFLQMWFGMFVSFFALLFVVCVFSCKFCLWCEKRNLIWHAYWIQINLWKPALKLRFYWNLSPSISSPSMSKPMKAYSQNTLKLRFY